MKTLKRIIFFKNRDYILFSKDWILFEQLYISALKNIFNENSTNSNSVQINILHIKHAS